MRKQIQGKTYFGGSFSVHIPSTPNECPICHYKIEPNHLSSHMMIGNKKVQVVFQCTRDQCQELFIAYYERTERKQGADTVYDPTGIAPEHFSRQEFSEAIQETSMDFIEIYNQALAAESHGLGQISGVGLRKAVEFLIKDFSIRQKPDDVDRIKGLFLGQCIEQYIEDPNIKRCAKMATWLGNDETHYMRIWADQDITDLKRLVRLTVNWIENVLETEKYMSEMMPEENEI